MLNQDDPILTRIAALTIEGVDSNDNWKAAAITAVDAASDVTPDNVAKR